MGKRIYSLEFRREAVRRASEPGVTLSQVAREIGIRQQTLHRWKKFEGRLPGQGDGGSKVETAELERLRRENIKLRARSAIF
jgi:transposase